MERFWHFFGDFWNFFQQILSTFGYFSKIFLGFFPINFLLLALFTLPATFPSFSIHLSSPSGSSSLVTPYSLSMTWKARSIRSRTLILSTLRHSSRSGRFLKTHYSKLSQKCQICKIAFGIFLTKSRVGERVQKIIAIIDSISDSN